MADVFYSDINSVLQSAEDGHGNQISDSLYDQLLRVLKDRESEVQLLCHCLMDLEHCVSRLGQGHKTLIHTVLNMEWLKRGPALVQVYQAFVLSLVSAHINLLKSCLRSLVKRFIPEEIKADLNASIQDVKVQDLNQCYHVHALLKSLCHLVPMTSVVIMAVLDEMFPYLTKPSLQHQHFSHNSLAMAAYLPELRMDLLNLVVRNMLKLDVRSSRLEISSVIVTSENDIDDMKEEEDMFDMEDLKDDIKAEYKDVKYDIKKDEDLYEKKPGGNEQLLASSLPLASSLDLSMCLSLEFIRQTCCPQGKLDWAGTKKLYRELLSVFDKYIFPTHTSCHVQFIMFYACSFKEELADGFIDYLWKKLTNPSTQSVYRQTAACYIGSFLTRAQYITTGTVQAMLALMSRWLHAYLDQSADHLVTPDLTHHGPFYSVCQALFYIFCFKHNDIIAMPNGHKWAEALNLQRLITSKLNPLRVCVPIIVKTFSSAVRMHQLAFCDTIIERNSRYTLPVSVSTFALEKTDQLQLEAYFPFDPYLLPRSQSYIAPLYREYSGSLPEEDLVMGDEDEDDFLPSDDEETQHMVPGPLSMSLGRSPADFLSYSVSPGFKHT